MRYFIIGIICFIMGTATACAGIYVYSYKGVQQAKVEADRTKQLIADASKRIGDLQRNNSGLMEENKLLKRIIGEIGGTTQNLGDSIDRSTEYARRIQNLSNELGAAFNQY